MMRKALLGKLSLLFPVGLFSLLIVWGSATVFAADTTAPGKITDLGTEQVSGTSIKLTWTAPGNDAYAGTATSYEIRYSSAKITETTWSTATQITSGVPAPAAAGTAQNMTKTGLTAGQRYWFAIKTSDGTNVSKISNSAANLIQSLDQADVYIYAHSASNSRIRNLIRVMQPDFISRADYEWIGTSLSDVGFDGSMTSLDRLVKDGSLTSAGVSGTWWAPGYEALGPGVNIVDADGGTTGVFPDFVHTFITNNASYRNQLIYKLKKQIDAGFLSVDLDTTEMNTSDVNAVVSAVKSYALSTYGRTIYVSGNGDTVPGISPGIGSTNLFTYADYSLRQYPRNWNGFANNLAWYRDSRARDGNLPAFAMMDIGPDDGSMLPLDRSKWVNFFRINDAQLLASNVLPGAFFALTKWQDPYENGAMGVRYNNAKFTRENRELFHNVTMIAPSTLAASVSNVYLSAMGQSGRTLVHLINGNYNNGTNVMTTKSGFSVQVSLSTAPTAIWMTTPDKLSNTRKQTLSYSYSGGIATIAIPELQFHDLIVIEQGSSYNPVYSPMEIVFPFLIPENIATGNKLRIHAVQTEGISATFNWYVNNVSGGNSTYGTIDANGYYTAPAGIPSGGKVTIKAVSKEDAAISSQFDINVVAAAGDSWTESFGGEAAGAAPKNWEIVDGRGDWKISLDSGTKVLHKFNAIEGTYDDYGVGYEPIITAGNQAWTNYDFQFKYKLIKDPVIWYNKYKEPQFIGPIFGYKDGKNFYQYLIRGSDDVVLRKVSNGVESFIGKAKLYTFPAKNAYVSVDVSVRGNTAALYINDTLVRMDTLAASNAGSVGISASMVESYFKDFAVNKIVVDDLVDWSKTYSHTSGLSFDTSSPAFLGGETSRAFRGTNLTNESIVWYGAGMKQFIATANYWDAEAVDPFSIYTSSDGIGYSLATPTITTDSNKSWPKFTYTLSNLSGVNYVKVQWNNTGGQSWNPQLAQVIIRNASNSAGDNRYPNNQTFTNLAAGATLDASSSAEFAGWGKAKAVDGQRTMGGGSNGWSSDSNTSTNHGEYFKIDLGASRSVGEVDIYPGNTVSFPADFVIYASTDDANWTPVISKTGYAQPANAVQKFVFPKRNARWIMIVGTNLRPNPADGNLYRMQFAEVEVNANDTHAYSEYFEDGEPAQDWTQVNGIWKLESQELSSDASANQMIYSNETTHYNFDYRVRSRYIDSGGDQSIVFRFVDPNNFYQANISMVGGYQYLRLYKCVGGTFTQIGTEQSYTPVAGRNIEWTISSGSGGSIVATIDDGTVTKTVTATDTTFTSGKIGVKTVNSHSHFDNITVD